MMRKRKTLKIDKKEITVKELTVGEIIELGSKVADQGENKDLTGIEVIKKALDEHMHLCVEGLTLADMLEMAPSEIEAIYNSFREVNRVFFEVARQVGLGNLLQTIKTEIQNTFLKSLADL